MRLRQDVLRSGDQLGDEANAPQLLLAHPHTHTHTRSWRWITAYASYSELIAIQSVECSVGGGYIVSRITSDTACRTTDHSA